MYDFESGDISLDFANTKDWHGSPAPVEKLKDFSDLVTWGEEAGLLTPDGSRKLLQQLASQPDDSLRRYADAIQLREAIYHIFSHLYAGLPVPEADLSLLNTVIRQAMAHLKLKPTEGDFRWEWAGNMHGIDLILWPVARAAAELLTSDRVHRVRECEDDRGCGYLFIDQTKNHSRRWCSMDSCGNRAKARRHYSRLQAG
jgi:predicted RNA-binding Zn ribbon-like protein